MPVEVTDLPRHTATSRRKDITAEPMLWRSGASAVALRSMATSARRTASRRRPPSSRKPPPPSPPPPPAEPTPAAGEPEKGNVEWLMSQERTEHLNENEKWLMRITVVSSAAAIACFTYTKWEVEARLKEELNQEERTAWFAGGYQQALHTRREKLQEDALPMPPPPPPPPVSLEGFVPAESFAGARDGMVYKRDAAGVGYYKDEPLEQRLSK